MLTSNRCVRATPLLLALLAVAPVGCRHRASDRERFQAAVARVRAGRADVINVEGHAAITDDDLALLENLPGLRHLLLCRGESHTEGRAARHATLLTRRAAAPPAASAVRLAGRVHMLAAAAR